MGSKTSNLFAEFKPVSLSEWEEKMIKDLKGKSIESLNFKPEFDLSDKAYYHPSEFSNHASSVGSDLNADNNDWSISQTFVDTNSKKTNFEILKVLNEGVSGLKITITEDSNFQLLFNEVLIEHIFTHIICLSTNDYKRFVQYLADTNTKVSMIEMPFLTKGLDKGTLTLNQLDIDNFVSDSAMYCTKNLVIDGYCFCQFGASTAQELAIALSQLNEYFQRLSNQKIHVERLHEKIALHLGITDNYFVNISKFRAVKELVLQLQEQWSMVTDTMPWTSGETVLRHMAVNDRHNNVLRQTTSAMAAVIGGVDQLVIRPYSELTENDKDLSNRLSKNIQLILKEEAFLNQVIDPGAGSYAIESLTNQLIEKAWDYFLQIENEGGYYDAIDNGFIHSLIEKSKKEMINDLSNGAKTLLGVNKFQNSAENWREPADVAMGPNTDFKSFSAFNLESHFENPEV
ncbi:MAG: methylmalonyl-CoA mutase family protein [Crocinitomicaceae bacterium]